MIDRKLLVLMVCCLLGAVPVWAADAAADPVKEGKQLEKAGKLPQALEVFEKGLQTSPTEELYRETGSLLGKMQKYDKAIPMLEEGLKKFPQSTSLMNLLGLLQFKNGNAGAAEKLWEGVLAINPDNSFAKDWLGKVRKPAAADPGNATDEPATGGAASSGGSEPMETGERVTTLIGDPAQKLPLEEQEKLATKLYKDMSALDKYDLASFDNLHRTVIRKCSDTEWAQESCWRLSNLYLMANDDPNYDGVIEVLEHLIKTYTDSPLIPEAKNRLLQAYRGSKQYDKVVTLYEELFKLNPEPDEKDYMVWALEYAEALVALDKKDQARPLYEKIIQLDNNRDQLEARVAREKLAGL